MSGIMMILVNCGFVELGDSVSVAQYQTNTIGLNNCNVFFPLALMVLDYGRVIVLT